MSRTEEFYEFIREREAIRLRRLAGQPWPWTDDPILRAYKFTNVKRIYDRTSAELIWEFYEPNRAATFVEVLFNAAIFRYFGTMEAARAFGWNTPCKASLDRVESIAAARRAAGARLYTGAYMVTNAGRPGAKHKIICRDFLVDFLRKSDDVITAIQQRYSMEDAIGALNKVDGFATFMSKEILLDTRYTDAWPAAGPSDQETWTAMGPGARKGASYIRYDDVTRRLEETEALEVCREVYALRHEYWPTEYELLILDDVQFQFCEFGKIVKTRLGLGRPRGRYKPEGDQK